MRISIYLRLDGYIHRYMLLAHPIFQPIRVGREKTLMKVTRWFCVLGSIFVLLGCATRKTPESLMFTFPPKDKETWVKGSESEDRKQKTFLVEFVRKGETVKNWTELFSVFNLLLTESSPTREQLMDNLRARMQQRCPNVEWKLIEQRSNDLLYEWRITKCAPHPDQHEIARIVDGNSNRFKISYTAKVTELTETKRKQWTDILLRAEVKQ